MSRARWSPRKHFGFMVSANTVLRADSQTFSNEWHPSDAARLALCIASSTSQAEWREAAIHPSACRGIIDIVPFTSAARMPGASCAMERTRAGSIPAGNDGTPSRIAGRLAYIGFCAWKAFDSARLLEWRCKLDIKVARKRWMNPSLMAGARRSVHDVVTAGETPSSLSSHRLHKAASNLMRIACQLHECPL